ncbi:MAG: YdeI/OmpD-associated family protein [Acidobacteriota bacterium]
MSIEKKFTAEILPGRGGGAYIEVPFDVEQIFGSKQPQVKATIEGETFPTRLMKMGKPCHIVGVPKAVRVKSGKDVGSSVEVAVVSDETPRVVAVPPDLKRAFLSQKKAQAFFDKLSYTHRKEYVRWIEEAKREETRAHRLAKTIEMLKAGIRGK